MPKYMLKVSKGGDEVCYVFETVQEMRFFLADLWRGGFKSKTFVWDKSVNAYVEVPTSLRKT